MPKIIETHAHIYDEQFDHDRDEMLKRAFATGVDQIWMPNCNHETIESMLALEDTKPNPMSTNDGLASMLCWRSFRKRIRNY
jgi:TatD DNase family protein